MSKINLGLIGTSAIAEEHLKVIDKIKEFKSYGITSRTNKNCQKLANKYKITKIYKNYKDMANDDNIDALLVLVSADQIFQIVKYLIPIKKPFFTEKPPGLNIKETIKLSLINKKYKTKNMVGFNRRFYSIFHKGIKIIRDQGKLLGLSIEGHERFWQLKNKKNLKNWIYVNSSHTIDLVRFFGGEIISMHSLSNKYKSNNNSFLSSFKFKSGILGNYQSYWRSPSFWSVRLYGDGLTVDFKPLEQGIVTYKDFSTKLIKPDIVDIKFKPGFYQQMVSFKNLIVNSKKQWPLQDITDSLKTVKIIEKITNET